MVILFDQFNLSEDVYEVIFATEQQVEVAKELIKQLKKANGVMNKTQMSEFATALHDGNLQVMMPVKIGLGVQYKPVKMSYNKRQFYDRILTPMKSMGMIDYDLYAKNYKLSDKFTKTINKLAMMWVNESKKPGLKVAKYA
ncbi:MAG TPA: hypothetical protein VK158_04105 [Acidobacteriota bacterium]|nr:hypothetical protein [Acidobacteriota bacterium]